MDWEKRQEQEFNMLKSDIEEAQELLNRIQALSHSMERRQEAIFAMIDFDKVSHRIKLRLRICWSSECNV